MAPDMRTHYKNSRSSGDPGMLSRSGVPVDIQNNFNLCSFADVVFQAFDTENSSEQTSKNATQHGGAGAQSAAPSGNY